VTQAFLFGDVAHNFEANSAPFVAAAGGQSARIALLLQGGEGTEGFLPRYRDPWLRLGAAEVMPIYPTQGDELPASTLADLGRCTGIFIGGGHTRRYHQLYARSGVGAVIRERYGAGIPFGGVSAGALIATSTASIADDELMLDEGLALLDNVIVGVHLAESGNLPKLIAAMERSGVMYGLGLDEPICAEIREGGAGQIHGEGRAYLLRRLAPASRFELRMLDPGATFELG
jgi:cyanophycinase